MDKIISVLRKPAKWVVIGSIGAYVLMYLLYAIGRMSAGATDAVFGGLFFIICFGALAAALIFAMIKGNAKVSRLLGCILFAYLAIRLVYSLLSGVSYDGGAIAESMFAFDFLATISGLAVFAIVILRAFIEKLEDNKILDIVSIAGVAGFIFFTLLARFLEFGIYGYYNSHYQYYTVPWYWIVETLGQILLLPAILFGYILLFTKESAQQETEATEETEEAPAEEEETSEEAEYVEPSKEFEAEAFEDTSEDK